MAHSRTFRVLFVGLIFAAALGVVTLLGWLIHTESAPSRDERARLLREFEEFKRRPMEENIEELKAAIRDYGAAIELVGTQEYVERHDDAFYRAQRLVLRLGAVWARALPAVPLLVELLEGPERTDSTHDMNLNYEIASTLTEIGHDAVLELTDSLKSNDPQWRRAAARTLGMVIVHFPEVAKHTLEPLIDAIHDDEPQVRIAAMNAVLSIGSDAKRAAPALAQALDDDDKEVRRRAAFALKAIDPDAAAQAGVK